MPTPPAFKATRPDIITDTFSELYPHAKSGEIRILAVLDEERPALLPDVPTAREQGFDVVLTTTRLLIVPAGTPAEIVSTLEAATQELIADPAYQAKAEERQVGIHFPRLRGGRRGLAEHRRELRPHRRRVPRPVM